MAEENRLEDQERVEDRSAADAGGGELMMARVQVVYENENGDPDLAEFGDTFRASEEEAAKLYAEGKADYAKEDDNGVAVVDEDRGAEATQKAEHEAAEQRAKELEEAGIQDATAAFAGGSDSSAGMKGAFAAESNSMPGGGDEDDKVGTFTDDSNARREAELHSQTGVYRDRPGQ